MLALDFGFKYNVKVFFFYLFVCFFKQLALFDMGQMQNITAVTPKDALLKIKAN